MEIFILVHLGTECIVRAYYILLHFPTLCEVEGDCELVFPARAFIFGIRLCKRFFRWRWLLTLVLCYRREKSNTAKADASVCRIC